MCIIASLSRLEKYEYRCVSQQTNTIAHTIHPEPTVTATSYLTPALINFGLNHIVENGDSSLIGQSVPSTGTKNCERGVSKSRDVHEIYTILELW